MSESFVDLRSTANTLATKCRDELGEHLDPSDSENYAKSLHEALTALDQTTPLDPTGGLPSSERRGNLRPAGWGGRETSPQRDGGKAAAVKTTQPGNHPTT